MVNTKDIADELRGKTIQVYAYLLREGKAAGVREVQKALGFSSPSVAFHHLEKLINLGIVEKDSFERYYVAKKVDSGILGFFISLGSLQLPRFGFYATFFSCLTMAYIIININFLDIFATAGLIGSSICFWLETYRTLKRSPF